MKMNGIKNNFVVGLAAKDIRRPMHSAIFILHEGIFHKIKPSKMIFNFIHRNYIIHQIFLYLLVPAPRWHSP